MFFFCLQLLCGTKVLDMSKSSVFCSGTELDLSWFIFLLYFINFFHYYLLPTIYPIDYSHIVLFSFILHEIDTLLLYSA